MFVKACDTDTPHLAVDARPFGSPVRVRLPVIGHEG
ncbi:hypothetical protein Hhis01_01593 [Haloarcula hispanica]